MNLRERIDMLNKKCGILTYFFYCSKSIRNLDVSQFLIRLSILRKVRLRIAIV